ENLYAYERPGAFLRGSGGTPGRKVLGGVVGVLFLPHIDYMADLTISHIVEQAHNNRD
ncbi:unnamed protein product, partial [Ectocarpus sp. 8 AP-2014]